MKPLKGIVERGPCIDLWVAHVVAHKEEPGWVFTYPEMLRVGGGSIDPTSNKGRKRTLTLRNVVLREHGIQLNCVPKVGLKIADGDGKLDAIQDRVNRVKVQTRKAAKIVPTVSAADVSPDRQGQFLRIVVQVDILRRVAATRSTKSLERFSPTAAEAKRLGLARPKK